MEAKRNILDARYSVDVHTSDELAGIQALISHGEFNPEEHTPSYYKLVDVGEFWFTL